MGPMLVAFVAVCFFGFALISAGVSVLFAFLAGKQLLAGPSRLLGVYVLGSSLGGGLVLVLFGLSMRWNVVGDVIMKSPLLGCAAWGVIGFGWSAVAAFALGTFVRRAFSRKART
jgi:hypothetical protein